MIRFMVEGRDRYTGENVTAFIDTTDRVAALREASRRGMMECVAHPERDLSPGAPRRRGAGAVNGSLLEPDDHSAPPAAADLPEEEGKNPQDKRLRLLQKKGVPELLSVFESQTHPRVMRLRTGEVIVFDRAEMDRTGTWALVLGIRPTGASTDVTTALLDLSKGLEVRVSDVLWVGEAAEA